MLTSGLEVAAMTCLDYCDQHITCGSCGNAEGCAWVASQLACLPTLVAVS